MVRKIPASEGLWFGLLLLGQITGILVATAVCGLLVDLAFQTRPLGLAVGVLIGSIAATATVVIRARKELGG